MPYKTNINTKIPRNILSLIHKKNLIIFDDRIIHSFMLFFKLKVTLN